MKFDTLLAQFLYQNKKLALPGIGTFTLDGSAVIIDESAKIRAPLEGISFSTTSPSLPDTALIDFIRTHTGKMKPLAEADLDSYLTLAQQFINIGKPLYLEGIGTIQRIKNNFEFIPGSPSSAKFESVADKQNESRRKVAFEEAETSERRGGGASRKMLILFGVVGTLALVAWGGYYLYTKNSSPITPITENTNSAVTDTSHASSINTGGDTLNGLKPVLDTIAKKDSAASMPTPVATLTSGNYKFVIETAGKERALSRYGQLKRNGTLVNMETKDSITFKLFVIIPATPADTIRLKDSLNDYYNYDPQLKRLKRLTTIEN